MKKRFPPAPRSAPARPQRGQRDQGHELTANPRLAAFRVLKDAADEGLPPEEGLARHGLLLSPKDLGLATALVYEVLRHRAFLDWLMASRLTAGRASPDLALALELGLAQLIFFDRLGDHAVVAETVNVAKAVLPGRQGLVNAVLRGLLRDREAGLNWPPMPPASGDLTADLALRHSYQKWFVKKLLQRLDPAEAEALLAAGNQATPPTLRINPRRGLRAEIQKRLPFETSPTALSPWGLKSAAFAGRPEDWPGFADGCFAIQDEASQLVGLLAGGLPPRPAILDTCAGLGGKALHLAALHSEAAVIALDKDAAKLDVLRKEADRLGVENIRTQARDLLIRPPASADFDLVLVDAPCTGSGVIRRRPDLKWNKTEDDVVRLAELQAALLAAASRAVKPGGRLIYGVCSFQREEGPDRVKAFLAGRSDFTIAPPTLWPEALRPLLGNEGLALWPHRHGTDGFFWAMLLKKN